MSVDVGSATGYLDLDISGFLTGLRTAQSEAKTASGNIVTTMSNGLKSAGSKMTSAGKTLTATVTTPIVGTGVAVIKMSSDFESAMSRVKAISGTSGKEFDSLRDKAKELGETTVFSATEVADGMTEMAKAGWNSQQIMAGMEGVLNAASASGENLANVSTIVADAVTGFGMEAKDATKIADLLTQAANAGTIDIADLGESFKYVAPIAGSLNLSIEDVTTALSAMSMAGIKGSQAGTSLRGVLARMAKPTDAVDAAMKKLGININNADGTFKSLDEIVGVLRNSFSGLNDKEKAYYATTLAGQQGMSGLLALLNLTEEEYNALGKSMDDCGGVAKETSEVMLDNTKGKLKLLQSQLEGVAIQLGDILLPIMNKVLNKISEWLTKFSELSPEQQEQIVKIAAMAAAIGPLLIVVGKLTSGVGSFIGTLGKIPGAVSKVKTGFNTLSTGLINIKEGFALSRAGMSGLATQAGGLGTKLGAALGGITAPVIAVVAAIALLTAAFVSLWKSNEEFREKVTAIWNEIKETFSKFCQGIVDRINSLGFDFENIGEVLKAIWKGFCDFLAPIFTGVLQNISNVLKTVFDVILGIVDVFIGIFTGDWDKVWTGVKEIFGAVWDGIVATFKNVWNTLKGVFDVVLGWFGTSLSSVWESIKNFFVNIWNNIVSGVKGFIDSIVNFFVSLPGTIAGFFTSIWNAIVNFVTGLPGKAQEVGTNFIEKIKTFFSELPYKIGYALGAVIGTIASFIVNLVLKAKEAGTKFVTNVVNFFKTLPQRIMVTLNMAIAKIKAWATAIKVFVTQKIPEIISSIVNWFKKLPNRIWNAIKSAATKIAEWAVNLKNKAVEGVTNVVNSVVNWFKKLPGRIWNAIVGAVTKIGEWGSNMLNKAKTAVKNVVDGVITGFKELPGKIVDIGKNLVEGLWNGINNAKDWVIDKIKSFGEGILDGIKDFFDINSPSRVMKDQVGTNIALGVIEGVNSQKKNAKKSAEELGKVYVDAAENKLVTLKGKNKLSLAEEIKYWKEIRKHTVAGTSAYTEADKKIKNVQKNYIKNAEQTLKDKKKTNKVSLNDEVKYWQEIQSLCKKGTYAYKEATKNMKAAKKKLNDELKELNADYKKDVKKVQTALVNDINAVMAQYDAAVKDRAKSITSSMGLFESFESTTENTKGGLIESLQGQVSALSEYSETMDKLKNRGVDAGLIAELQEAGVSSLADIKLIASMTDKELNEYVALWQKKNSLALTQAMTEVDKQEYLDQINELINQANKDLDSLEKEYKKNLKSFGLEAKDTSKEVGKQVVAGIKAGIKSDFPGFLDYVCGQMNKITSTAKKALKIKSPSRVFKSIGGFITEGLGDGFVTGMKSVNEDVKNEVEGLADVDTGVNVGIDSSFLQMINMLKEAYSEMQIWFDSFDTRLINTFNLVSYNLKVMIEYLKAAYSGHSFADEFGYVGQNRFGNKPKNPTVITDKPGGKNPGSGDIFNFYSPKAIDEVEAAKQMKIAKRDLAEGF